MRRFAGLEGANAAETWGFAIAIKKAWASGARPLQASLRFRNPWLYWSTIAIVLLALAILGYLSKIDPVLDDRVDVLAQYIPSGWMGDGVGDGRRTRITWDKEWTQGCHSSPCVRVEYRLGTVPGAAGFAGMYLQNLDGNWGQQPGRRLQSRFRWRSGYRRLSFWARADDTAAVEFLSGDIHDKTLPYMDSFAVRLGALLLTREWKPVEMDLSGKDLSSVIGAFA